MPYRAPHDRDTEAATPTSPLSCSACNVPVAEEEVPRCPKCLRKTTIVDTRLGPAPRAIEVLASAVGDAPARPPVWPVSRTCPVCAKVPVDGSVVFLRVSKTASDFGSTTTSACFRVSVCAACHRRVHHHDVLRYVAVAALLGGLIASFGLYTSDTTGITLGFVGLLVAIASIGGFVARNRMLRAHIDSSGITDTVAAALPGPRGLFEWSNATLHDTLPTGHKAVDLAEARGEDEDT